LKEQGMDRLFGDIELPLCSVLAHMEHAGFFIDRDQLTAFGKMLGESISVLQRDIFSCAGTEFNINSTKQLGEILFEKLMLPSYSKDGLFHKYRRTRKTQRQTPDNQSAD
jgi:DNA polymerase-1